MRIIITCGDPNGIGLELVIRALAEGRLALGDAQSVLLCAPPDIVRAYATVLVRSGCIQSYTLEHDRLIIGDFTLPLVPINGVADAFRLGEPTCASGAVALEALEYASHAVMRGEYDAVVTLPVSKEALRATGFQYPGQTEYLGSVANATPLMILACNELRVALVTIHEPIAHVASLVTIERVRVTIENFHRSLTTDFAREKPTIAVLGLNPHAGEHGMIGCEEETVIRPALEHARDCGIHVEGPFPADSFFARGAWKRYDGVIAQYHDQGLIPLKMIARGRGVNITAGLPFVRTSPDHGTAYDIAGQCRADYRSFLEAIRMALYLASNRKRMVQQVSPSDVH